MLGKEAEAAVRRKRFGRLLATLQDKQKRELQTQHESKIARGPQS